MEIVNIISSLDTNPDTRKWLKRDSINYMAVHHSETTRQTVYDFNKYHIDYHGWYKISYHYVIDKRGIIYQCNDDLDYTYHIGKMNRDTLGICLVGDFDKEKIRNVQLLPLIWLLTEKAWINKVPSSNILGHQEFTEFKGKKTCPGKNTDMPGIRTLVAKELVAKYDAHIEMLKSRIRELEKKSG